MNLLDFMDLLDPRIINSLDSYYSVPTKPLLRRLPKTSIINIINL